MTVTTATRYPPVPIDLTPSDEEDVPPVVIGDENGNVLETRLGASGEVSAAVFDTDARRLLEEMLLELQEMNDKLLRQREPG